MSLALPWVVTDMAFKLTRDWTATPRQGNNKSNCPIGRGRSTAAATGCSRRRPGDSEARL